MISPKVTTRGIMPRRSRSRHGGDGDHSDESTTETQRHRAPQFGGRPAQQAGRHGRNGRIREQGCFLAVRGLVRGPPCASRLAAADLIGGHAACLSVFAVVFPLSFLLLWVS